MYIVYVIFALAIVWVIYYLAWRQGAAVGYHDGWADGYKKGQEEGMSKGIKVGIKEHLINSLAGATREGALPEVEQQVRRELLASLTAKPDTPAKPTAKPGILAELWQRFGWWAVLCVLLAVTVYAVR